MEVGETIEHTVVRETREETGLDVVAEQPVGIYTAPHAYYAAKGMQIVALVFLCRVIGGQLSTSDETTEFGWFDPLRLPADVVPTHPQRIADALAVRRGGPFCVR
jgi:8-oxo-dGTP diphosphatase